MNSDFTSDEPSREKILEYIDRGLDTFGVNVRMFLYWKMEKDLHLRREEIPEKPESFTKAIENFFGAGSRIVERTLIKELKHCPGIKTLHTDNLADAITDMRKRLQTFGE